MTSADSLHPSPAGLPTVTEPASSVPADATSEMVISKEQLVANGAWVESGHVRLRRRVVSETRTVDVVVRREELVVETLDVEPVGPGQRYRGTALDGPPVPRAPIGANEPLVILLREELPEVVVHTQVYERVTAHVETVTEMTLWRDSLRHEEISVDDDSSRPV
ncbi:DUF2382 domain-containing protein [uncultured Jatrophihabitans sp.]|uniref:DUF2382 domain-containing protein n=1 Tax=uncultured Jatrophihabitans sp. TaxID=1610747 RepID=UPI0035CAC6B1